jgi:hypothetical protein
MRGLLSKSDVASHANAPNSNEGVDELDAINISRAADIFGVKNLITGAVTGTQKHAIPMGEAETGREVQRRIKRFRNGQNQGKEIAKNLDILIKFHGVELSGISPSAELLCSLSQDLPKHQRGSGFKSQMLQQLLSLFALNRFVMVDGIEQDIGINGDHAVGRGSGDLLLN